MFNPKSFTNLIYCIVVSIINNKSETKQHVQTKEVFKLEKINHNLYK